MITNPHQRCRESDSPFARILEIEGINSIGKSVLVSFCVRVLRASGQARRSGVGAYGVRASNAGGIVAKTLAGPGDPGGRLLRVYKGFKFFFCENCAVCNSFMQRDSFGCAGARVLREYIWESFEHIAGHQNFKAS